MKNKKFLVAALALALVVALMAGVYLATRPQAVDGGKNAALLALQIIAVTDAELAAKLDKQREDGKNAVLKADAEIMAKYNA